MGILASLDFTHSFHFSKVYLGFRFLLVYTVELVLVSFLQLFYPNNVSSFMCVNLFCYFLILMSFLTNRMFILNKSNFSVASTFLNVSCLLSEHT
jgi:hypothetical protein